MLVKKIMLAEIDGLDCFLSRLVERRPAPAASAVSRAANLSLLNFLSLFRDLQKSKRFSGGGGGGSSRIFPLSSVAKSHFYPTSSDIRG